MGRAAPEVADRVAEFIVPLRPARRETPDLIAAWTAIPWFCDQLHRFKRRVLAAGLEKSRLIIEAIWFAGEDGAEIETETVDMGLVDPIAQAIGDHLDHPRVRQIQRVSG